ncbi:U-scoloptoxin(05)-Er2a-like [Branchiostoma floridae x Branchiostoma japonicum]
MSLRGFLFIAVLCSYLSVAYGIKCVICSGNFEESQACVDNTTAQDCPSEKTVCYSTKWTIPTNNEMTGFTRGCAIVGIEPGCYKNADKVVVCTSYCLTDGCNTDDPGSASSLRSSAILIICTLALVVSIIP